MGGSKKSKQDVSKRTLDEPTIRTLRLFVEIAQVCPLLLVDDREDAGDGFADGVTIDMAKIISGCGLLLALLNRPDS